ncbi:MAG TPA: hypothetical protein VF365_13000 [Candidatus Limnocylindria bacterium]
MSEELRPDEPLRSIAEALWNIGQGYTIEDLIHGPQVNWHPLNAEDAADEAMHMGHAAQVLDMLIAAGWTPPGATPDPLPPTTDNMQHGHNGRHHGTGAPGCPKWLHHHHDERCTPPATAPPVA